MRSLPLFLLLAGSSLLAPACGGQTGDGSSSSPGGTSSTGGTSSPGGTSSTGGTSGASGASSTGGASAAGGSGQGTGGGSSTCPAVGCICPDNTPGTVECSGGQVTGCLCSVGAAGTGGAEGSGCPAQEPASGGPCSFDPSGTCEYGSDLRSECRHEFTCQGGTWQDGVSKGDPSCAEPLPGPGQQGCPADLSGAGQACSMSGEVCDMGGGAVCGCAQCPGGLACLPDSMPMWYCAPAPAGCPAVMPDAGQTCAGSQQCTYGNCETGLFDGRSCQDGVWQEAEMACAG